MLEQNQVNKIDKQKNLKVNKSCNDLFHKDFDYPSLNRKDLMSLSTINKNDFPIRKFKQIVTNRDWSLNLYNLDIEGSSPRKFGIFSNKMDYTNKNNDIDKSYPLIPKVLNKPNYNLSNEDIEASKPNCSKCQLKRHTNPLEPKYSLPKGEEIQINDQTKFIRDNLYIDDIIGARSKKSDVFLRNTLNKDDLKDSFPKRPYFIRKDKYNNLDYNDISKLKDKNKRFINPIVPIYSWKYPINNMRYSVGPIEGNYPNPFSQYKYANPFNLRNDDIEGSNPGSKNIYKKFKGSNSCLNIRDISGAIHGSLVKGITTKRNINPISPQYKYPGEDELKMQTIPITNNKNSNVNNKSELNNKNNNIIENNNSIELTKPKNTLEISNENNFDIKVDINEKPEKENTKIIDTNKNKSNDASKIYNILSDLNEYSSLDNEIKFDKNVYKKPDIYYPIKHDQYINPHIRDYNKDASNHNPKLRSHQQVINEKIRLTNYPNYPNHKKISLISKNPKKSYENKMDDFFVKSTIDNFKLQQRLKNNINAYYDIGFPEELKTADIDPKF